MTSIHYNKDFEISPFGFKNIGVTCYFNALIQSLLSCTSFTQKLIHKKEKYSNNPVGKLLIELIEIGINDNIDLNTVRDYSPKILKKMVTMLHKKKNMSIHEFMNGMQCAGEGYHYLLETLEEYQSIQNLFLHRYKSLIRCFNCKDWISKVECMYSLFEVEPGFKTEQLESFKKYHIDTPDLNSYLSKQSSYVDNEFRCSRCNIKKERFRINVLVMVPEILVVMSKKYNVEQKLNVYTEFPERMEFEGKDDIMVYKAVAQIEHSGGRHGGHYWAICKRKDGWYNLNDMSVVPSKFQPTNNTFIVMYNLI